MLLKKRESENGTKTYKSESAGKCIMFDFQFFKNKKVLITGHTGFKGSWLSYMLWMAGTDVTGYSLPAPTSPALYDILDLKHKIRSVSGDIRDIDKLKEVFADTRPEIVIHLAAQPIVRKSYEDPVGTYSTNVMGTVNMCECVRLSESVKSFLNVTTDKVYQNEEIPGYGYKECDKLDGFDPYSNSKSCSELVTHSYIRSFYKKAGIAVSTARAGNVIGGGDFAKDRIIPDCFRAAENGNVIYVRNPYSTRPYQHVLEPLSVYLDILERQYDDYESSGFYNVGPDDEDCVTTGALTDKFVNCWGKSLSWEYDKTAEAPHEALFLKLDSEKIKRVFDYKPTWHIDEAVKRSADWYKAYLNKSNIEAETQKEIKEFFNE